LQGEYEAVNPKIVEIVRLLTEIANRMRTMQEILRGIEKKLNEPKVL